MSNLLDRRSLIERAKVIVDLYPELEFTFYLEFNRRFEVVKRVATHVAKGSIVCDLGSQPFILSAMIKLAGYDVIAVDIEPEKYIRVADAFGIPVVKADLERDVLSIDNGFCDSVVLSEVLEHLNPYYVPRVLAEINRILKMGGYLIVTTPNVASLFRRIKLLLGRQPVYRYHIKEYTKPEVERLLEDSGFEVVVIAYSEVNDKTYLKPKDKDEIRRLTEIEGYMDMLKFTVRNLNVDNMLRVIAYPLIKIVPSTRMMIIAVAKKTREIGSLKPVPRW